MFRIVFIAYFFSVALAGPSFCCCRAAEVGAWLATATGNVVEGARPHACCGHHGKASSRTSPAWDECDSWKRASGSSDGDCRCPEHATEAIVASPAGDWAKVAHDFAALEWPFAIATLTPRLASPYALSARGRPVGASFVHFSGRDILRSLQRFLL